MFKKLGSAAAVLALAGAAFSAFAPATYAADPPPDVLIHGAGTLSAHGTGIAAVKGLMDYHASGAAGDLLLVKDINGDANIDVTGYEGTGMFHGFTVYFNFRGSASIRGTDVAAIVVGHDIDLRVAGKGWAFLKGRGEFHVNGGPAQPWTDDGAFAGLRGSDTPPAP